MREILVKSLTSSDLLRRDCAVTEQMRQGLLSATVVRRCTYRVESQTVLPSIADAMTWARNLDPLPPRQIFVTKDVDPATGAERVCYKVFGHFYVVLDAVVFCVGYRHLMTLNVEGEPSEEP